MVVVLALLGGLGLVGGLASPAQAQAQAPAQAPAPDSSPDSSPASAAGDGAAGPAEDGTASPEPDPDSAPAPAPATAAEALGLEEDAPLSQMLGVFDTVWDRLATGFALADHLPQFALWLELQANPEALANWWAVLWQAAVAIGLGLIARWGVVRLIDRPVRRVALAAEGLPRFARWVILPLYLVLRLVPLAVFALGVNLTLPLIQAAPTPRLVAGLAVNTLVAARALHTVLHILLLPPTPALTLAPIRPRTAQTLYASLRRLVTVIAAGFFAVGTLEVLAMPSGALGLVSRVFGLIAFALVLILIRNSRRPMAGWLRARAIALGGGGRAAKALGRLAEVWHIVAGLYATVLFLTWFLDVPGGFRFAAVATVQSVGILLGVWLAGRLLEGIIARVIADPWGDDAPPATTDSGDPLPPPFPPPPPPRTSRALGGVTALLRGGLAFAAVILIIEAWGGASLAWMTSGPKGGLLGTVGAIFATLIVALLVWEGVFQATEKYLSRADAEGRAVERSQRARTLVPLGRTVLMILMVVIVSLMVLSELGVNIAPLLAGAGVLGLAVSFGSQKLVQDVITGAFCLIEDTLAVGDVVTVGGYSGVVEALSIRSIRLRDLSGTVHTIPFSTVGTISNMTKDFSYYVMDIGVAYRENTDAVCAVLKAVDEELRADPAYGPDILDPLEILGVDAFADSAVVIKARLKTRPIKQWVVGREFNRRMKQAFDAAGIEIPFPHTTLYFGADRAGQAPPALVRLLEEKAANPQALALAAAAPSGSRDPVAPAAPEAGHPERVIPPDNPV